METHSRRTLLRYAGITALAVAAGPAIAACGTKEHTVTSTAALVHSNLARRAPVSSTMPAGVDAVDHLTAGLYPRMAPGTANVAFSPFSIALALAMTANGAAGETQQQMLGVLGDIPIGRLDEAMNALVPHLVGLAGGSAAAPSPPPTVGPMPPGPVSPGHVRPGAGPMSAPSASAGDQQPTLRIADAIFGQTGLTWKQPFLDALAADYGAGLHAVDFGAATEAARGTINQWTSDQTSGKISQILAPGSISPQTALVLVNAIYFKARWAQKFAAPRPASFHLADGSAATVPMMTGHGMSSYGEGSGWQAGSTPYFGDGFAMTVVVPDSPGSLPAIESQVAAQGIAPILQRLVATNGWLTMPTFSVRTNQALKPVLSALGMPLAFTQRADFRAMTDDRRLEISDVLHEAVVDVDQNGTEAAAATAAVMVGTAISAPSHQLVADRPFLFVIHDIEQGTPLFVGRISDPRG